MGYSYYHKRSYSKYYRWLRLFDVLMAKKSIHRALSHITTYNCDIVSFYIPSNLALNRGKVCIISFSLVVATPFQRNKIFRKSKWHNNDFQYCYFRNTTADSRTFTVVKLISMLLIPQHVDRFTNLHRGEVNFNVVNSATCRQIHQPSPWWS